MPKYLMLCLKKKFLTILGNLILYDYKLVHQIDLLREHFQLYTQFPRNIIVS